MKTTKNQKLKNLRKLFDYYEDGTPKIYSYGVFKAGVTCSEIDDYLAVRLNTFNIKKVKNKIEKAFRGSTCSVAKFDGKQVCLVYRHDLERFANAVINNEPTYFD